MSAEYGVNREQVHFEPVHVVIDRYVNESDLIINTLRPARMKRRALYRGTYIDAGSQNQIIDENGEPRIVLISDSMIALLDHVKREIPGAVLFINTIVETTQDNDTNIRTIPFTPEEVEACEKYFNENTVSLLVANMECFVQTRFKPKKNKFKTVQSGKQRYTIPIRILPHDLPR